MRGEPLPCFPLALVVAEQRAPRDEARACRFWLGGVGEAKCLSADGVAIVRQMPGRFSIWFDVPLPSEEARP